MGGNNNLNSLENNILSPMFKAKIYYIYFPTKAMPIYNKMHVEYFLRALGIPFEKNENIYILNFKLIERKNRSLIFKNYSNLEFMNFLYSSFGFKKDLFEFINKSEEKEEVIIKENIEFINDISKPKNKSYKEVNFEEINNKKRATGMRGEDIVLAYEKNINEKFKSQIKSVANIPTYGYDILSYDLKGNEKHIEVKTCSSSNIEKINFFITENEKNQFESDPNYLIYYVCGLNSKKKTIYIIKKEDLFAIEFKPVVFKIAAKAVKKDI